MLLDETIEQWACYRTRKEKFSDYRLPLNKEDEILS